MRKYAINIALTLLTLTALCSCEKEIKFNGKYDGHKIVLYSSANPGTTLSARIYRTSFILDRDEYKTKDSILSGATIIAEINGKEYPMVEETSVGYFADYTPKPGDHIKVSATVKGFDTVWGETVVPDAPQFSVTRGEVIVEADQDWQRAEAHFKVTINDQSGVNNYYSMKLISEEKDEEDDSIYQSTHYIMSKDALFYEFDEFEAIEGDRDYRVPPMFEDGGFAGKSHTFDIFAQFISYREYDWNPDTNTYEPGDIVPVKDMIDALDLYLEVHSWSESLYRYDTSYRKANNMTDLTEIFGEPVKISCNINGGGIGCVGAGTTKRLHID